MKIVILGTAYPFRGGLSAFNERLAQELMKMGHQVQIITFTIQYPSFLFPGKSQMSEDPAPPLEIHRWIHSFNPLNWIVTGKKIKKLQPDIIICKYWLPIMGPCFGTILRLAKCSNTQVISILDNIIPHEKRPGDYLFTRYFVRAVDRFIYMSRQVGDDLMTFDPIKPAQFIPHPIYDNYGEGVDQKMALQKLALDDSYRYVLFFGFIRDYKGLDLLYEAIAILKSTCTKVKFIIAGEYYTDPTPYHQLIEKLDIESALVQHTHFISNEDVKYYFSACDLVVQPYKSATQSGIAQIAIHFKKPTVVTKVGGLHEIIEDQVSGYVVEPNKEEIAKAIQAFFNHPNPKLFDSAITKVQARYAWSAMADAVVQG